jgi:DNA-3-methyladenine glycosylase
LNKHVYPRKFFERPTLAVARDLLGSVIHRTMPDGAVISAPLVEVEAYTQDDPACHAWRGLTERTRVMFGPPGHAYVYFIYGMYFCLNVVTEKQGIPGAVLIRAVATTGGNGPGRLCRQLAIDKSLNGADLRDPASGLWLTPGEEIDEQNVIITTRVGINAAHDFPWRYYIKGNPFVSKVVTKIVSKVGSKTVSKTAGAKIISGDIPVSVVNGKRKKTSVKKQRQ